MGSREKDGHLAVIGLKRMIDRLIHTLTRSI